MTKYCYPAVFHPEETGYSVSVPDLQGCFTQGDTMDEAMEMAQDAVSLMLEDCTVCPEPSSPADILLDPNDFVVMISFNEPARKSPLPFPHS